MSIVFLVNFQLQCKTGAEEFRKCVNRVLRPMSVHTMYIENESILFCFANNYGQDGSKTNSCNKR